MFDREYNYEADRGININFPKEINITEKRAPTDESIKIYNELVEKAKLQVVDSLIVKDTLINGAIIYFMDEPWNGQEAWFIKFSINGEEKVLSGKLEKDDFPFIRDTEKLRQYILKEIAMEVLKQLMDQIKINGPQTRNGKLC